MKCGERPGTINNLCLTCDDDWREAAKEYKMLTGREAGEYEFYIWTLKPKEWDETKKNR